MSGLGLGALRDRIQATPLVAERGRVTKAVGQMLEADLPGISVGTLTRVGSGWAEVVGFREHRALLMPLGPVEGLGQGAPVEVLDSSLRIPVGERLLGRILGPLGEPLDGRPLDDVGGYRDMISRTPHPLERRLVDEPLETGIRCMDGLITLGLGQRVAIMAGSGVGKSTLLGMLARHTRADMNVIVLVGERGREVREFLERDLGEEGLRRSVVVLATGDRSPILQVKSVLAAMAIAEHFRDQGKKVLLMADSLTRLAMAQRQIGLAAGEPPTARGYTPSVFALLPTLLERAGPGAGEGSITGVFTVLVEGDDVNDPVADTVRGIVDGHVVLSRRLASHGHYPAIDVLQSLSRTMPSTTSVEHRRWATATRDLLATWSEHEELIRLGAYRKGSDPMVDRAIALKPAIDAFLKQEVELRVPMETSTGLLARLSEAQLS